MSAAAHDSNSPHRGSRARMAAGSLLQTAARAVVVVCGILLAAYLARRLAAADYGSYAVALVITGWVSAALGTAATAGSIRLLAAHQDGRRFAVTMLQASLGTGLLAWTITALSAPLVAGALATPSLALLLLIVAADIPASAMAAVYSGVLTGEGRFALGAGSAVVGALARLLLVLLFLESGMGVAGAALAVPFGSLVQVLWGRCATGVPVFSTERAAFGSLWRHTRLLAGAALALRVSHRIDLLAVKLFSGSAAATGYYAGAQSLASGPLIAFTGSPGVVTQAVARARAGGRHDEAVDLAGTFLRTTMAYAGLIVAMGGLASDAVVFVLGNGFAAAGPVLALLLWASAFRVLANGARAIIAAVGEEAALVRALVLAIAAGVVVYALVIPRGGIVAAAGATAVLGLVVSGLSVHAAVRLMDMRFPWASLGRVMAASAVGMLVAALVPGTGVLVVIRALVASAAYGAVLLVLREWRPESADAATLLRSLRQALGAGVGR